jgi:hypothetical protein
LVAPFATESVVLTDVKQTLTSPVIRFSDINDYGASVLHKATAESALFAVSKESK